MPASLRNSTPVILVLFAAVGSAAGGQSPGKKIIPGHRTIELEADFPGYAFFTVREEPGPEVPGQPPKSVWRAKRVELVPKVPQVVSEELHVVPESALKDHPNDEALGFALSHSGIPGAHSVPAVYGEEVDKNDPRTRNEVHILLQRVDPNAGLIYDRTSNDPTDPRKFTDQFGNPLPGKAGGGSGGGAGDEKPESRTRWPVIAGAVVVGLGLVGVLAWVLVARASRPDDEDEPPRRRRRQ